MEDLVQIAAQNQIEIANKYVEHLSDMQLQAASLAAHKMSKERIAKYMNLPLETIQKWSNDIYFRVAVDDLRKNAQEWNHAMLNQASTFAWKNIMETLTEKVDPEDKLGRTLQSKMAQFIISELSLKTVNVNTTVVQPELRVSESSMDLLARKVHQLEHGNDNSITVHAVPSDNAITTEFDIKSDIVHPYHKDTEIGVVSKDGDKFICHVCGERCSDLVLHLRTKHNLTGGMYRKMYKLPPNALLYNDVTVSES